MRAQTLIIELGILGALMCAGGTGLHAQSLVRKGSFEIGPFLGASYGIDDFRVIGGGNVTFALTKRILPYAEYSYFPGIGRSEDGTFTGSGARYTLSYSIPLSDIHAGFHIRFPIRESPVVPYLVIGFGGLRR